MAETWPAYQSLPLFDAGLRREPGPRIQVVAVRSTQIYEYQAAKSNTTAQSTTHLLHVRKIRLPRRECFPVKNHRMPILRNVSMRSAPKPRFYKTSVMAHFFALACPYDTDITCPFRMKSKGSRFCFCDVFSVTQTPILHDEVNIETSEEAGMGCDGTENTALRHGDLNPRETRCPLALRSWMGRSVGMI